MSGAIGGLLYAAVRPWLAGLGPWRGVAFGLLLLGVLGSLVLDPNNFDFGRFGPVWLNVGMFAALLVIFGGLLAPAIGWIERRDGWGAMGTLLYLASLPPLLFAALGVVQIVGALIGGMESTFASGLWLFTLLVFAVALRWYFARTGVRLDRPVDPRSRRAAALSYAVLALPVAAASWLTLTGIVRIFQMAV